MNSMPTVDIGASLTSLGDAANAQATAALKLKSKAKDASEKFEAVFLNSMFEQMMTGIDGEGPFGGSGALKVWRSFMTDQFAKSFAKAGGIGIAPKIYNELLKEQGLAVS
jgi:peptidoglycan hydrolase FlgJ